MAVDQQPFALFVDAKSGATIDGVLIISKHYSSKGVSSASGHGPGYMTNSSFVAARTGRRLPLVLLGQGWIELIAPSTKQ